MANHKSAKKRARQTIKKNAVNHSYITSVRTAVKSFRSAVTELAASSEKDIKKVQPFFAAAQSKLMKAASKGLLKKNTAARTVRRMDLFLKKALGSSN
ncbi:MAG: 30S ribosomal protein S20 [Bdellovibrionota bacterium]